jgi:hypothetical protein
MKNNDNENIPNNPNGFHHSSDVTSPGDEYTIGEWHMIPTHTVRKNSYNAYHKQT